MMDSVVTERLEQIQVVLHQRQMVLAVSSQGLMVQSFPRLGGMRYGAVLHGSEAV
jgi:hypothetical protein